MRALAVALAALGVLDTMLASARGRWRPVVATAGAAGCAALGAIAVGCSARAATLLAATVAAEAPLWAAARRGWRPRLVLGTLAATLVTRFATAGLWSIGTHSLLDRWAWDTPFSPWRHGGVDRAAYIVGALVFLATAGNTLVRLLLDGAGALLANNSTTPGGGRVIGSLERVLIFALAVGGEATAAALVVSAKGILRFPEMRKTREDAVDSLTEYVLVGSLASYVLALSFVPLALA